MTTTQFYTGDLNNSKVQGDMYLLTAPGLKCPKKQDVDILGDLQNAIIENCQYYYALDRDNTSPKVFGCIKCKFGFTGEIEKYTLGVGYIKKCEPFNQISFYENNTMDSTCIEANFLQGWTNSYSELEWNLIPLETYLSCHECNQTDN